MCKDEKSPDVLEDKLSECDDIEHACSCTLIVSAPTKLSSG